MSKTTLAHLALITAMCIYALSFSLIKEVTPSHIAPLGFVLMRILGAAPLFWLCRLVIRERVDNKDLPRLLLLSVFGVALNQSLFMTGMSRTAPISAGIIMITSPLLVLVIGNIILRERITLTRLSGILLGLAGAALLILTGSSSSREDDALGDLFIFINALSWGTYLVLVKPLMSKYHTVTILSWVFLFGGILVFPFGIQQLSAVEWHTFTGRHWFDVLFVVFGITFVAYLLNTYALSALSPSVVSAYIYLQPLLAAAIALWLGKDVLSWQKIVSALFIFTGVWLASRSTPPRAQ
ncbi:MAG: DMT family transporter [Bacteroidia bacterium]|jgi:drug/metabolite transporter (DMT)-like permease|nr:DMT family transporter [Bacteroidia bacterium]